MRFVQIIPALAVTALLGCEQRSVTPEAVPPIGTESAEVAATVGTPGVTDTAIRLGSYGPLSGPAAAWGVVLHSMKAYFDHINESGGIHGRKIEFLMRDDQYSPAKTPAIVRELVEKEEVFALVGALGTANGRAVADYLESKDVPFFTPASGDRFWSEPGKKNVFTVYPKYATEGQAIGDYVVRELEKKKVAVLYQNDDFGQQGKEGLEEALKRGGGEIVAAVSCLPTDTDLSGQVSRIVSASPEVLVLFSAPKQAVMAVKQLHAMKKKPQLVTSFVLGDPLMFKLAGEDVWEGTITSAVTKLATGDDPSVAKYREVLEKHGGGKLPVGNFTVAGFSFAMPLVEAMHRAGKDLTRERLYAELKAMKDWEGGGPHWTEKGLLPAVTFGEDRHLGVDQIYFAVAKAGQWEKLTDWRRLGDEY